MRFTAEISLLCWRVQAFKNSKNERKIEGRSKRFERERKVLQKLSLSASATSPAERERCQNFWAN